MKQNDAANQARPDATAPKTTLAGRGRRLLRHALVFITAVHSASPEYNFEVFEYLPNETVIRVFGVSRYDRIAKKLDIERYLSWPELLPFLEGVAEEMGIKCKVEGELKELGEEGRYDCVYRITL